jgi:hypothetical protein
VGHEASGGEARAASAKRDNPRSGAPHRCASRRGISPARTTPCSATNSLMSAAEALAVVLGLGGVLSAGAWGLLRERRAILAGQAAQVLCFAGHFFLIGAHTGAAMCGLSLVQLAAAASPRSHLSTVVFWATAPAMALLTALTWHGSASAAAALGLALGTLGRWQRAPFKLRCYFAGSSVGWAAHNLVVMSPFGLATDALALTTNGSRIWRGWRPSECKGVIIRGEERASSAGGALPQALRKPRLKSTQ